MARVVPPLAPARSDEDGSALPAFIAQSVDTPWWQEAKVTTPALLGAVVVVALLLCVVVATVNRANRRVCAVLRDNANALAALAVAKADQLSTSEAADVAAAVAAQMNRAYYEQLIAAVEHALAGRGYRFGHDAFREATLPLYVVLEASRVFVRAQIKYLYPLIRDADLDKKIEEYQEDGYSEKFVRSIVEAMRGQGRFVEAVSLASEQARSSMESV
ncbi:hypothetical protein AB8807_22030 (plasmid) [Xanthomonas campestris pv. olitorii]|nr:hypothetical protein KWH09_22600 [Xanthomonas campestris pv. olitorii]